MLLPLWVFCSLAETHRAPFDFSESESELVSGFNTEYSGAYFAFIFLTEYGVLLVSSYVITYIFVGRLIHTLPTIMLPLFTSLFSLFISFVFIWIRVTYVRYRYDLLMMSAWKRFLPVALFILILSLRI